MVGALRLAGKSNLKSVGRPKTQSLSPTPSVSKKDVTAKLFLIFLRQQLKTRDVFFKEEITYLRNLLDDCLRCSSCSSKKESNASIHQKRKPNSAENSSASESTEKQKDDTSKKDNMGENKKKSALTGPTKW